MKLTEKFNSVAKKINCLQIFQIDIFEIIVVVDRSNSIHLTYRRWFHVKSHTEIDGPMKDTHGSTVVALNRLAKWKVSDTDLQKRYNIDKKHPEQVKEA